MSLPFKAGDTVEVTCDLNAVPRGSYQFIETQDNFLIFSVGKRIIVGVSKFYLPFLKRTKSRKFNRTSVDEFLSRYYILLEQLPDTLLNPEHLTFCAIDPSLAREVH